MLEGERDEASATATQDCTNTVNLAVKRLELRGCGNMISYLADGSNTNTNAPTDGSCSVFHPNGGGAKACNASAIVPCDMTALVPGQTGCGVVYVGMTGGKRIYTTPTNSTPALWNNGAVPGTIMTAATSSTDGMTNTNILVGLTNSESPYNAAAVCRALGEKWYLPSTSEGSLLLSAQNIGDLSGTFGSYQVYWASQQQNADRAYGFLTTLNLIIQGTPGSSQNVRCVRSD